VPAMGCAREWREALDLKSVDISARRKKGFN
jgi:hypothetical protein